MDTNAMMGTAAQRASTRVSMHRLGFANMHYYFEMRNMRYSYTSKEESESALCFACTTCASIAPSC